MHCDMKSILDLLKDKPEITPDPVVQPLIPSITILPTIPEVVDEATNTELIQILGNLKKERWDEYKNWNNIYCIF